MPSIRNTICRLTDLPFKTPAEPHARRAWRGLLDSSNDASDAVDHDDITVAQHLGGRAHNEHRGDVVLTGDDRGMREHSSAIRYQRTRVSESDRPARVRRAADQ